MSTMDAPGRLRPILAVAGLATLSCSACVSASRDNVSERPPGLAFCEFYTFGPRAPTPTPKVLSLHGKRVALAGYRVQMERPPRGGFYLAPYPALCDESGAGRGGLPPPSVLVLGWAAGGEPVAFVDGPLELTGILYVGNEATEDGEAATVRLFLDDFTYATHVANRSAATAAPRSTTETEEP